MNKLNKKLVSRIVLCVMMISLLVFFTGCSFSSSSIDLGINQILGAFKMAFDALVDGIVTGVVGLCTAIWEIIVGLCTIIVGVIAWVWELIVGLF